MAKSKKTEEKVDLVFEREQERMEGMQELLTDYLDSIDNTELDEIYNLKKWVASELIMYLAYYVAETHYEMVGILDECKEDLRIRNKELLKK